MKRSFIAGAQIIACFFLVLSINAARYAVLDFADTQSMSAATKAASTLEISKCSKNKAGGEAYHSTEEKSENMHYTEEEIIMVAKVLYRECRGILSTTEKACVVWTICNRVDSDEFPGGTIAEIVTYPNAFAYIESTPVWDELYVLAEDVLSRWNAERNGAVSVGRVLPPDFEYFSGDGEHNYFRNEYTGDYEVWDYSLDSPYES